MKPIKLLLTMLPNTSWDDPEMEQWAQRQRQGLIFLWFVAMPALLFALNTWQQYGLIVFVPLALFGIAIFSIVQYVRKRSPLAQQLGQEALRLRAAAEGEDDQLAPLAAEQPVPLPVEEQQSGVITLGPLWHQKTAIRRGIILEIILGIIFIPLPLVVFLFALLEISSIRHDTLTTWLIIFFAIIIACMMMPLAYGGVQVLRLARQTMLSAYVLVDEQAIYRQRPAIGKRSLMHSLDWKQARSFFIIAAAEPGTDKWLQGYALDAHSLLLTWQISHRSSAQERAASDMLCRQIVTHTRLPLRDLSAAAEQINWQIESERQERQRHSSDAAPQAG